MLRLRSFYHDKDLMAVSDRTIRVPMIAGRLYLLIEKALNQMHG